MQINLPNLGTRFELTPQNQGNTYTTTTLTGAFDTWLGTYLVTTDKAKTKPVIQNQSVVGLTEFVAPAASSKSKPTVVHTALGEVSPGKSFQIKAHLLDVEETDKVTVELQTSTNKHQKLRMYQTSPYLFDAIIPADLVRAGVINYRILIQRADTSFWAFPGGYKGNPYAWDYLPTETYQTYVATDQSSLSLFEPITDRAQLIVYSTDYTTNTINYTTDERANV